MGLFDLFKRSRVGLESPSHKRGPPTIETFTVCKQELQGKSLINQYKVISELGSGSSGIVLKCINTLTNEQCAIKIISKSWSSKQRQRRFTYSRGNETSFDDINREIAILKKISNHPNIVQLMEVIDDNSDDDVYLVFELCEKGPVIPISMFTRSSPIPENQARTIFKDIVLGVEFIHSNNIAHCDLKPDNLLLTSANRCFQNLDEEGTGKSLRDYSCICFARVHSEQAILCKSERHLGIRNLLVLHRTRASSIPIEKPA